MTFGVEVTECRWMEEQNRWRLTIRDQRRDKTFFHEASVLFSASGQLVYPAEIDVPGTETFKGDIFHSARWRQDVSLEGKDVVVFGNGCTANQIVPAIVERTKSLTQIVRSKHWVFPPIDMEYPGWMRWMFKHLPFVLRLHRFHIFLQAESQFRLFPMTKRAAKLRQAMRVGVERYMRTTAPKKYHDILIPDFDIGCKRRIFDSGYLKSLHASNLRLTNKKAVEIVPEGVRTEQGLIKADVIVMANGFRTNEFVSPLKVVGRNGELLTEHWEKAGGPEAYNCSVMSGFPNFFLILGPNAATGHTSAIMASENTINYALRILKPVITGKADTVEIRPDAEFAYSTKIQDDLAKTVWNSGCHSWYVKEDHGRTWNAMSYPYSQVHFWYRSVFPTWKDWKIKVRTAQAIRTFHADKREQQSSSTSYNRLYIYLAFLGLSFLTAALAKVEH